MDITSKKIVSVSQLARLTRNYQKAGKKVGCMSGSFDVVTGKHYLCCYEYARHCDVFIVLVNSNASVQAYKGSERPIVDETERCYLMAQSVYVKHVALFEEVTPVETLKLIRPDIFLNSSEWGKDCVEKSVVERYGGAVKSLDIVVPEKWSDSSSVLMAKVEAAHKTKARAAVFLDRDGVINENGEGYISSWGDFKLKPKLVASLKRLTKAGYPLFIVTNQSGIGRGFFNESKLKQLHKKLEEYLKGHGITIEQIYYCPHHPDEGCLCRKPSPEMLLRASREHNLNLSKSWFIGDSEADVEAGRLSNTPTIYIGSTAEGLYQPNYTVSDIKGAVDIILSK